MQSCWECKLMKTFPELNLATCIKKTFKIFILFELNISFAYIYLKEIIEHIHKIICKDGHCSILFKIKGFEAKNQGWLKTLCCIHTMWLYAASYRASRLTSFNIYWAFVIWFTYVISVNNLINFVSRLWNSQPQTWNNQAQAQTYQPLALNNQPQAGKNQPQAQSNQLLAQINLPQAFKKGRRRWPPVNTSAERVCRSDVSTHVHPFFFNDPHPRLLPSHYLPQTHSSTSTHSCEAPVHPFSQNEYLYMITILPSHVWKAATQVEMPLQMCIAKNPLIFGYAHLAITYLLKKV